MMTFSKARTALQHVNPDNHAELIEAAARVACTPEEEAFTSHLVEELLGYLKPPTEFTQKELIEIARAIKYLGLYKARDQMLTEAEAMQKRAKALQAAILEAEAP